MPNDKQQNNAQVNYLITPPKKPSILKSVGVGILGYLAVSLPSNIFIGTKIAKVAQNYDFDDFQSPLLSNEEIKGIRKLHLVKSLGSLAAGFTAGMLYYRKAQTSYKEETAHFRQMLPNTNSAPEKSYTGVASMEEHKQTPQAGSQEAGFQAKEQQREPAVAGVGKG